MIVLALLPTGTDALAQAASVGLSASDVKCVVEPEYSFTAPPDAWLNYPDARMMLGEFAVGELLLASGESLSITLSPGALATVDGNTIPYTVTFDPPQTLDEHENGKAYNVAIEIDPDAFRSAAGGTYTASLLFCVVSYPANKTVWQKETVLTINKAVSESSDEPVPSTGFLATGFYLWFVAAIAAFGCIMLILIPAIKKAKTKKNSREETSSPDAEQ